MTINIPSPEEPEPPLITPKYWAEEYPRPACEHDPMGVLSLCPVCGPNRTGQVVKVQQ